MFSVQRSLSVPPAKPHAHAGETKKSQTQTMLNTTADALRHLFSPASGDVGKKIHQCSVNLFRTCLSPKPVMKMHYDKHDNIVVTLNYTLRSPDLRSKGEMQVEATFEKGDHTNYQLTLRDLNNPLNIIHLPTEIGVSDEMCEQAKYVCYTLSLECLYPEPIAASSSIDKPSLICGPQQAKVVPGVVGSDTGLSTAMLLGDGFEVKKYLQRLVDDKELNQSQRYDRLQAKNSAGESCLMQAMLHGHYSAIDAYFEGLAKLLAAGKISGEQAITLVQDKKDNDYILARTIGNDNVAIVASFIKGVAALCLDKYVTDLQIYQFRESIFNSLMTRLLDSKTEFIINRLICEINLVYGYKSNEVQCWFNNISLMCVYAAFFIARDKNSHIELYKNALEQQAQRVTLGFVDTQDYFDNINRLVYVAGENMPAEMLTVTLKALVSLFRKGSLSKSDFIKLLQMTRTPEEITKSLPTNSSSRTPSPAPQKETFHLLKCKDKETIKSYFKMLVEIMAEKLITNDELCSLLLNIDSTGIAKGLPLLSSDPGSLSVGYGRFINGLLKLHDKNYLDNAQLFTLLQSQNPETLTNGIYQALFEGDHVFIRKMLKYLSKIPQGEKVLSNAQIRTIVYGQEDSNILALDLVLNMARDKDQQLAYAVRSYVSGLSQLASQGILDKDELINHLLPLNKPLRRNKDSKTLNTIINHEILNGFFIELSKLLLSTLPDVTYLHALKSVLHRCVPLALSSLNKTTAQQDINFVLQTLLELFKKGIISEVEFTNLYILEDVHTTKIITGDNLLTLLNWFPILINNNLLTLDGRVSLLTALCNPALNGSLRYNPETFSIFLRGLQTLYLNGLLPLPLPEKILLRGNVTAQPYIAKKLRSPGKVYPTNMSREAIAKQKDADYISACSMLSEFKTLYFSGIISKEFFLKELTGLGKDGLTSMEWAILTNRKDVIATYFNIVRELTCPIKFLSDDELNALVMGTAQDGIPLLVKVMSQGTRQCIHLYLQCLWQLCEGGSLNLTQFGHVLEARDKEGVTALHSFMIKNSASAILAYITYLNGSILSSQQILTLLTIKKQGQTAADLSLPAEAIKVYNDTIVSQAPILKLSAEQVVSLTQTQWRTA